jgi:hypothetical protein
MNEFRDLSRLPGDAEYWEQLEARVVAGLPAGRPDVGATRWWSPLEAGAVGLGATAVAALLAALLFPPPRARVTDGNLLFLLAPADPALVALLASPSPPALASLVLPAGQGGK